MEKHIKDGSLLTAEEFLKQHYEEVKKHFVGFIPKGDESYTEYSINHPFPKLEDAMIEFAKLHVEAALKAASENAEVVNKPKFSGDYNPVVDEDSILNAYPLDQIK